MGTVAVAPDTRTPEEVLAEIKRRVSTALLDAPPAEFCTSLKRGTEPPGPFPAVVAWLLALVAPSPPPPYVLALVVLLERIGDGTADDHDRARLAAWLPNGIHHARLVHDRDPAAGAELLAELGATP